LINILYKNIVLKNVIRFHMIYKMVIIDIITRQLIRTI